MFSNSDFHITHHSLTHFFLSENHVQKFSYFLKSFPQEIAIIEDLFPRQKDGVDENDEFLGAILSV